MSEDVHWIDGDLLRCSFCGQWPAAAEAATWSASREQRDARQLKRDADRRAGTAPR